MWLPYSLNVTDSSVFLVRAIFLTKLNNPLNQQGTRNAIKKRRDAMEIRVHTKLGRLTSMTLAKVKAHFKKALTMLFNLEKFDQGFQTLNSTMIE